MREGGLATGAVRVAAAAVLHGTPVEAVVGPVAAGIAAAVAARRLAALIATGAVVARPRAPVAVGVDAVAAAAVRLAVLGFLLLDVQLDTVGTVAGEIYGLKVE